MKELSYSVVIRTLGNTGLKYKALLDSIAKQTIQPEEIIVAIPEGYELDYSYGNEHIVRCKKGMTTQRAAGILAAKSEYILVVDDDVEFDATMVEELYQYMIANNLNCCLPMEGVCVNKNINTMDLRRPLSTRLRSGFTGQMFTSRRKSKYLDVLTLAAGHKVYINSNNLDTCYLCTTACFQCFFIETKWAKAAHYEEETWLEEGSYTSYSGYDEPVFFSKLNKLGLRMAYALRTRYKHLDAGAGHRTRSKLEDKSLRYFSIARNRTVYWYRFIYRYQTSWFNKLRALFWGMYSFVNWTTWTILINCHPKYYKSLKYMFLGYKEAFALIRSTK